MPGPYAHITLLQELVRPVTLESIFNPSSGYAAALRTYFPYCALGAVSPDYPNLAQGDESVATWADAMHDTRTCEMITAGIRRIRWAHGTVRDKQLAWLLGYCAHVATDVTIHPVVQAKVGGVYAENQRHHRICEMNQDSYIYRRMNMGEIGVSDVFARTVAHCSNRDDSTQLDHDIVTLWEGMLKDVHPELYARCQPDCASWHWEFIVDVAGSAAGAAKLFPLAGVIAAKMAASYPEYDQVDRQYIDELIIPSKIPQSLHYDDIFDHATDNVAALWRLVERAVCDENASNLPAFGDWNPDTGLDEFGRLVFWD
jgi:hypothetical protein